MTRLMIGSLLEKIYGQTGLIFENIFLPYKISFLGDIIVFGILLFQLYVY